MLATPADARRGLPDDAAAWAYEIKWDGMRVLADLRGTQVRMSSRTGHDVTVAFPELADVGPAHPDALLDGEVVVLRHGLPSFAALADRMHVRDPRRARALAGTAPATFLVFDLLRMYGVDLTGRPWQERREALERVNLPPRGWQLSPVYDDRDALLAATREQGLEGVVAKRRAARYQSGARSGDWVKLAHRRVQACLVGGWRAEVNTAGRIGALLLGVWDADASGVQVLRFAGRVGSGLAGSTELTLRRVLDPLEVESDPFGTPVPRADAHGAVWVRPQVVVEVRYKGRTEGGRLREPVFRGLRTDVDPANVHDE